MSVLEWPADLTDLRLPPAWDGRSATMFRLRAPVPTLVKPRIDGRRARLHHHRTLRVLQHDHRTRDRAGRDKRMDVG